MKAAKTYELVLDDPTPMPESALLMATAQIMAEGGAKHSPFNCNNVNSKTDCAASKKAKSEAARKRGAERSCAVSCLEIVSRGPENHIFDENLQNDTLQKLRT